MTTTIPIQLKMMIHSLLMEIMMEKKCLMIAQVQCQQGPQHNLSDVLTATNKKLNIKSSNMMKMNGTNWKCVTI